MSGSPLRHEVSDFNCITTHRFVRLAVVVPRVKVASPKFNAERTIALAQRASAEGASIVLFPELGLSAYSNDDLFQQEALLSASLTALESVVDATNGLAAVLLVGAPLRFEGKLFNCAITVYRGKIIGVTAKTYLPNYREFYEKRQFVSGRYATQKSVRLLGQEVPFGNDLVFEASNIPDFAFHTEICEDVWTPIPPSTYAALSGATLLFNLSASNITVGKADYRHSLCASQSARCIAAYAYAAAGHGESTTDLAWDGHAMIYENGDLLAETARFSREEQVVFADVDLERLAQDRMRLGSFADSCGEHRDRITAMRRVTFEFQQPRGLTTLLRKVPRFPYVPAQRQHRNERCYEAYNIQVEGLCKRLESARIQKLVIGVSGGLDSTHALIVAVKTMEQLGLPRSNVLAYTMPGFATSAGTKGNAWKLMETLGVAAHEIDIRPSCLQMLKDLEHPYASGQPVYDITFENVQAGERTSHLFRLANYQNALVLGTGDLSELALGWCTYGVGDHMSHYNVNASVPKTLIQHLIHWVIESKQFDGDTSAVLQSILDTEISPELIPGDAGDGPAQSTQAKIGPYELQDFNLYWITRFGFRPSKVAFLAKHAWGDANHGDWPEGVTLADRRSYDMTAVKKWLEVFCFRFFATSQFKRSCVPNGPKVGSGGSLSPRGDWRAPSDAEAEVWLEEIRCNVPNQ